MGNAQTSMLQSSRSFAFPGAVVTPSLDTTPPTIDLSQSFPEHLADLDKDRAKTTAFVAESAHAQSYFSSSGRDCDSNFFYQLGCTNLAG